MPDHFRNMLMFAMLLFVNCYTCSKMFIRIWKLIKSDTCSLALTSHNVTWGGVSCPWFVVLGQCAAWRHLLKESQHVMDKHVFCVKRGIMF